MPQYFSPGVYVEEVDSGPRPIQGASTSVAGAVGVTRRGPTTGKPELVTSFNEFVRKFGGFLATPDPGVQANWSDKAGEGGHWWRFAHSVKGFFDNGGQQLYVKRVFSKPVVDSGVQTKGAKAAAALLARGVVAEITRDAKPQSDTFTVRHLIGINEPATVRVVNGKTGAPIEEDGGATTFTVSAYDQKLGTVTLKEKLKDAVSAARGDYVEIHRPQATATPLEIKARALGAWGKELSARLRPMVGATLTIRPNDGLDPTPLTTTIHADVTPPGNPATDPWKVQLKDDNSVLKDDDAVVILGNRYKLSNIDATDPKLPIFVVTPRVPGNQQWKAGTVVRKLRRANNPAGAGKILTVSGGNRLYAGAIVELDNNTTKEVRVVESVSGGDVTLDSKPAQQYLEGDSLRLIEAEFSVSYKPDGTIEAEESFANLRLTKDGSASSLAAHVNRRSQLVQVELPAKVTTLATFPIANSAAWEPLVGGDDALGDLSIDDFVGVDGGSGKRTGIQALEDIDDISIVLAPGVWSPTVRAALIQHSEAMRYRFAIFDPPLELSIGGVQEFRSPIDTKYGALYYPWLRVRDPLTQQNVATAPSAHVAGVYARVDTERGVHKAPANEIIRGILPANPATGIGGLLQDVTKREQDLLNPEGINALRFFPGRGQRIWGARTVSSDSNFKYINVRRIFNFIEKSIDEGTQFVVFEPNDETLWARVRQTVGNFLNTQWRNGVLEGAAAEDAYFVACDRGVTMAQDDIENGRLICEIGIAPVFPAEFVIFRIQKFTAESKLS